ncbi:hypothetical protein SARC_03707 [Sphaeroforma arctica JP610]|uniref:Macro domain-containing protein n=1 Tax=Sphaeroforma arctica JP610 TaxID=667725 RepID=A0A0L0G5A1_9EUKA|nr:hypothetical protein SARC_03707 [Sphaeroforma arctica JP610]KNC84079.1 hypothetical protein SARC_03707 [Sphaeroforma arctica JP610]|eukprot:XP_014157981.1 hypothetical protein SARC_03707 [Sphaeroforma arctica JP610]
MVFLGAAYRLTLLVAVENYEKTGCTRVYLTAIGGGVFGNKPEWICEAMRIALIEVSHVSLEVFFVSYGRSDPLYSVLMRDMSV